MINMASGNNTAQQSPEHIIQNEISNGLNDRSSLLLTVLMHLTGSHWLAEDEEGGRRHKTIQEHQIRMQNYDARCPTMKCVSPALFNLYLTILPQPLSEIRLIS